MKQKVVRTYPPHPGYKGDTTGLRDLQAMLEAEYRVVMVNTVSCNGCEWLEYIVEKEEACTKKKIGFDASREIGGKRNDER